MQAATTKLILNNMRLQLSTSLLFMYTRYHKAFSHFYARYLTKQANSNLFAPDPIAC